MSLREKGIAPIHKADKGLAEEANGVRLMEPITDLDSKLDRAVQRNMFGAKRDLLLHAGIRKEFEEMWDHLATLSENELVMLKLSIPDQDGFYRDLLEHPRVLRVVALSGGYSREEAVRLLARNPRLIASFSRALLEGLMVTQSDEAFNAMLGGTIEQIYSASIAWGTMARFALVQYYAAW